MPPRRARLARIAVFSSRVLSQLVTGLWALHSGFWLGLLGDRSVDQATEVFYASDGRFGDRNHNRSGLREWEVALIERHCPDTGRVLVPAAGGGREVLALATMGYEVVGYDPSARLVELGRRLIADVGVNATMLQTSGNTLPPGLGEPFDWVLFGWGGISHIRGAEHRRAVFTDLQNVLVPGGVVIVSYLDREEGNRRFGLAYMTAVWIRRLRRSKEIVEPGDTIDGSFDHYFTHDEIAAELAAAGLEVIDRVAAPYAAIVCRSPA